MSESENKSGRKSKKKGGDEDGGKIPKTQAADGQLHFGTSFETEVRRHGSGADEKTQNEEGRMGGETANHESLHQRKYHIIEFFSDTSRSHSLLLCVPLQW